MLETNAVAYQSVHLASIFVGLIHSTQKEKKSRQYIFVWGYLWHAKAGAVSDKPRQTWVGFAWKIFAMGEFGY